MRKYRQIFMYFAVSGLAALANFISRSFYSALMSFEWAVTCAYFTGMILNFALSSRFVFSWYEQAHLGKVFAKFALVAGIGLTITVATSTLALQWLLGNNLLQVTHAEFLAHAIGIGVAFFASYAGHRLFTYRHTGVSGFLRRQLS